MKGTSILSHKLSSTGGKFIYYWSPVVLYLGIIFYLSSISIPKITIPSGYDKVIHIGEYAILAILLYRALYISISSRFLKFTGPLVIFLCFLYGLSDEYHQSFVPDRFSDLNDLMADTTGAIMGTIIVSIFSTIKKKKITG